MSIERKTKVVQIKRLCPYLCSAIFIFWFPMNILHKLHDSVHDSENQVAIDEDVKREESFN